MLNEKRKTNENKVIEFSWRNKILRTTERKQYVFSLCYSTVFTTSKGRKISIEITLSEGREIGGKQNGDVTYLIRHRER